MVWSVGEHPFEETAEAAPSESWDFEDGEEIALGLHALEKLGGGKACEAYLAWDDQKAFLLVAKIVRPHLVEDREVLRGLAREAAALGQLEHPLIVRGFGAVLEGPRPFVLMEHLEGPNLARLIRRHGPLPLEQLLPLAVHICSALHYLAAEQMVHLDVKPRNIVMSALPRLIDFSVARSLEDAKKLTGHVGTDLYMAPEQCDPTRGVIGPPADVWGLGVSLYRAISGGLPFERPREFDQDDPLQRFRQLKDEPRPLSKEVPREVGDVVLQCLRKDPSARPQAIDIGLALGPLLAMLPRNPGLGFRRPRLRPRRR